MSPPSLTAYLARWEQAHEQGQDLTPEELCPDRPDLIEPLRQAILLLRQVLDTNEASVVDLWPSTQDGRVSVAPEASVLAPSVPEPTARPPAVPVDSAATQPPDPALFSRRTAIHPASVHCPPGYDLEQELGRGGMGVVYRARQRALNRLCALKMILAGGHAGTDERARFLAEAEALAKIRHPGIVEIFDYGTCNGLPYFSLELCEGGSLADRLQTGPLPPREAARLIEQISRAIHAAHEAGIIHRDLKPANVLLAGSPGRESGGELAPRVTDFGLARIEGGSHTQTGAVMGTPSYMAPEQARDSTDVGPRSDVWALGAILYECLTGRPPFRAATPTDTLLQVLNDEPVPPRQMNARTPTDLETIALKCLQKDPGKRYPSAADLADDLIRYLEGEPIQARPAGAVERAVKWARRRPTAAALLVGGVLASVALLGLSIVAVTQWRSATRSLAHAECEQRERALAQVSALRDAAPGAVPTILADLEANRQNVLPRLRALHAETAPGQERVRLALGLLPIDPELVRDEILDWMLKVDDPAEVLLLRDRFSPQASDITDRLWSVAEDTRTASRRRFRAMAALARLDATNLRWKKAAPAVIDGLMSANPLHLGVWVEGLEPVRDRLLDPLGEVFRGKNLPEHRQAAAQVLARYAADRPERLAELALDADARQYALLAEPLLRHRQSAAAHLEQYLRTASERWKDGPPNPAWQTPLAILRRAVEQADGLVADRWALCQALPLERLRDMTEGLRPCGYRPTRVRPWNEGDTVRVAVVWIRDGKQWSLNTGLTGAQAQRTVEGQVHADLAGYRTSEGDRFAVLWREAASGERAMVYAGVSATEHKARTDIPRSEGYVPATIHRWTGRGGGIRYAGVWWKQAGPPPGWNVRWGQSQTYLADQAAAGDQLLFDVAVAEQPVLTTASASDQARRGTLLARLESDGLIKVERRLQAGTSSPETLVEAARLYTLAAERSVVRRFAWAAGLVAAPGVSIRPGLPEEGERYASHAVALLRQAVQARAPEVFRWRVDPCLRLLANRPEFQDLLTESGVYHRYASVWRQDDRREGVANLGQSPEAHLRRCRELAALGYRPAAISVAIGPGGTHPAAASVWHRPAMRESEQERLAYRLAQAGASLLRLGRSGAAWPLLRHQPDPTARSFLVRQLASLGVDPRLLIDRLKEEGNVSARRALILALGEYSDRQLPDDVRRPLVQKLLGWYRDDPDPGIHGAIDWLLRHDREGSQSRPLNWGQRAALERIDADQAREPRPPRDREWSINQEGMTFAHVAGPVEFLMGSPANEADRRADERRHVQRIDRSFALATKLVTVEQWQRFLRDRPDIQHSYIRRYSPEPKGPIVGVTFHEAMEYCNWLSWKEGIPRSAWCYPEKLGEGMKAMPGHLTRTGYRLPTEAEWEYACRAGSTTSRYYGSPVRLLPRYAWFQANSENRAWPVGQKRPNDLGLFDMHGNVWTWCQDPAYHYESRSRSDKKGDDTDRVRYFLRGGSFGYLAPFVRSSVRIVSRPSGRVSNFGLRVCRTLP